jgi:hypothetical protein
MITIGKDEKCEKGRPTEFKVSRGRVVWPTSRGTVQIPRAAGGRRSFDNGKKTTLKGGRGGVMASNKDATSEQKKKKKRDRGREDGKTRDGIPSPSFSRPPTEGEPCLTLNSLLFSSPLQEE